MLTYLVFGSLLWMWMVSNMLAFTMCPPRRHQDSCGSLLTWDACETFRHFFTHLFLNSHCSYATSSWAYVSIIVDKPFLLFVVSQNTPMWARSFSGHGFIHEVCMMRYFSLALSGSKTTVELFDPIFASCPHVGWRNVESLNNHRLCPIDLLRIWGRFHSFWFFFSKQVKLPENT